MSAVTGAAEPGKPQSFQSAISDELQIRSCRVRPSAEIAVMGPKGAVEIIFRKDIADPDKIAQHTKMYEDRFLSPFVAAERGYIDEVIMPHSTRKRIARALRMLRNKDLSNPWKKHDNIPL